MIKIASNTSGGFYRNKQIADIVKDHQTDLSRIGNELNLKKQGSRSV